MQEDGQVYFDLAEHIPEADAKRLLDADTALIEREEIERIHREVSEEAIKAELATVRKQLRTVQEARGRLADG